MTGFGRTGRMFASEHEDVVPDMMVLGKGLIRSYLPLAITLISENLFSALNGSVAEVKRSPTVIVTRGMPFIAPQPGQVWRFLRRRGFNRPINQSRGSPPRVDY